MKLLISALIAITLVPNLDAIRCYDYTSTNLAKTNMKTWVDCPNDSQYCYKSFLEVRDSNNENSYVEGRACGTNILCMQDGCVGRSNEKACCCRGDLCNSSGTLQYLASIFTIFAFYFLKM